MSIQTILNKNMGFISNEDELNEIIKQDRLQEMLVRCGNGRFLCPAQDVKHFVNIIKSSKKDHVRDISLVMKTYK